MTQHSTINILRMCMLYIVNNIQNTLLSTLLVLYILMASNQDMVSQQAVVESSSPSGSLSAHSQASSQNIQLGFSFIIY